MEAFSALLALCEGTHRPPTFCTLRGHKLEVIQCEKDIEVFIGCDLSFDLHIVEKVNKAIR